MLRSLAQKHATLLIILGLALAGGWVGIVQPALATPDSEGWDSYVILDATVEQFVIGKDGNGNVRAEYGPRTVAQAARLSSGALQLVDSGASCPFPASFVIDTPTGPSTSGNVSTITLGDPLTFSAYAYGELTTAKVYLFRWTADDGGYWRLVPIGSPGLDISSRHDYAYNGQAGDVIRFTAQVQSNNACWLTHEFEVLGTDGSTDQPPADAITSTTVVKPKVRTKNVTGDVVITYAWVYDGPTGPDVTRTATQRTAKPGDLAEQVFSTSGTLGTLTGESRITVKITATAKTSAGQTLTDSKTATIVQRVGADQRVQLSLLPMSVAWTGERDGAPLTLAQTHTAQD